MRYSMIIDPRIKGQHQASLYLNEESDAIQTRIVIMPIMPRQVNDDYLRERYRRANKPTSLDNMLQRWCNSVPTELKRRKMQPLTGTVQGFVACLHNSPHPISSKELDALLFSLEGTVFQSFYQIKSLTITNDTWSKEGVIVGLFREVSADCSPKQLTEFCFTGQEIEYIYNNIVETINGSA